MVIAAGVMPNNILQQFVLHGKSGRNHTVKVDLALRSTAMYTYSGKDKFEGKFKSATFRYADLTSVVHGGPRQFIMKWAYVTYTSHSKEK